MQKTPEKDVQKLFDERGCTIVSYVMRSKPIEYICKCGETKRKTFADFRKHPGCNTCSVKATQSVPEGEEYTTDEDRRKKCVDNFGNLLKRSN